MELKVWVDGIQRIVSGVNDDTTCQDVVIALAHAMGRTGRFTLIEKWREVERPLSANEFPLRVLHKWGEYANEVKFFLCQSDSDKFRRNDKWKKLDRFTHNFSPPVSQTSSVVKRSLTFSGAHNSVQPESSSSSHLTQLQRNCYEPYPNSLSPRSSSQSHSSTSSSVHLSPQQPHCHPHSSASIEFGHSSPKTLPIPSQLIPNSSKFVHDRSAENHQFSSSQEGFSRFQPGVNLAPVELSLDSPHHSRQASLENIEEYNLDQNFPDNLRESGRLERSQGHSEHTEYRLDEHEPNRPESEKCRLLRLVSLQKERLKVQKSELDVIETEIVSLEEKDREYDKDMQKISSDILSVEERQTVIDSELKLLESIEWIEVLQQEQTKGRELQLEISKVKDNLCQCERNINETVSKQKELEDLIQKEKQLVHSLEEENKEKEAKLKNEIKQLQEELDSKEVECENGQRSLSEVMSELNEIETQLEHKHHEADSLEEDLQKINMKEFVNHPPDLTKKSESGQVVLKLLEGRLSPRTVTSTASKTSSTPLSLNTALSAKNPNGVWV